MFESFNTSSEIYLLFDRKSSFWVEITTVPNKKTSLMSRMGNKTESNRFEVKNQDVGSLTGVPKLDDGFVETTETGKKTIFLKFPNLEVFST